MTDTNKLIEEFLAKGGQVRKMARGARTEVPPEEVKRRFGKAKKTAE